MRTTHFIRCPVVTMGRSFFAWNACGICFVASADDAPGESPRVRLEKAPGQLGGAVAPISSAFKPETAWKPLMAPPAGGKARPGDGPKCRHRTPVLGGLVAA